MSDLLPCPFCGSPAKMERFERGIINPKLMVTQIQCTNDEQCLVCVDVQHVNEAVAVEAWNTRHPVSTAPVREAK